MKSAFLALTQTTQTKRRHTCLRGKPLRAKALTINADNADGGTHFLFSITGKLQERVCVPFVCVNTPALQPQGL